MEIILGLSLVWFMSSVAIGVGSSTLAIASFIVALSDGQIDQSERRMLGVIYFSLRVAMVMIALSLFALGFLFPGTIKSSLFLWVILFALVVNSIFMTKHLISFKIGPALQAATWYTLGFIMTIEAFALLPLTWSMFLSLYAIDVVVAIALVNGIMLYTSGRNSPRS